MEYTLADLARVADVTTRTVRYYIEQGLLPSPKQLGPNARYTESHLERLRLIKKLQAAYLPLAEIRGRLDGLADHEIAQMSASVAPAPVAGSAIDYVRSVLREPEADYRMAFARTASAAATAAAAAPAPVEPPASQTTASNSDTAKPETSEPDRSQWERISLHPDVELHIRRPLGRIKNKRVDRLITIARQLLEDE